MKVLKGVFSAEHFSEQLRRKFIREGATIENITLEDGTNAIFVYNERDIYNKVFCENVSFREK